MNFKFNLNIKLKTKGGEEITKKELILIIILLMFLSQIVFPLIEKIITKFL